MSNEKKEEQKDLCMTKVTNNNNNSNDNNGKTRTDTNNPKKLQKSVRLCTVCVWMPISNL